MAKYKERAAAARIKSILEARGSELHRLLTGIDNVRVLPRSLREQIVEELGAEFVEKGLRPDFEPNDYGLEIEDLTEACGLADE